MTTNALRWKGYLGLTSHSRRLWPYHTTPEVVLKIAAQSKLNPRRLLLGERRTPNRVSDFTDWIYAVLNGPSLPANLAAGKTGEREVAKVRLKRLAQSPHPPSGWRLVDEDPLDGKPRAKEISKLQVDGKSLYGAPDYVFENESEATIIVVEIKVSPVPLPSDGWPNLRAQLWAYGWIDAYVKRAKNIVLIGEVWGERDTGFHLRHFYRWLMSEVEFCDQNERLFQCYKEKVEAGL